MHAGTVALLVGGRARARRRRLATGSAWPRSAALLVYEHALVRPGDLRRLDAAFFTVNGVISVVFFAFVALDMLGVSRCLRNPALALMSTRTGSPA